MSPHRWSFAAGAVFAWSAIGACSSESPAPCTSACGGQGEGAADGGVGGAGGSGGAEEGCGGESPDVCDGDCVNLLSDIEHCGGCGVPCPDDDPNGAPLCLGYIAEGWCATECDPGYELTPPNDSCQPVER